jgi:hypothetical protein
VTSLSELQGAELLDPLSGVLLSFDPGKKALGVVTDGKGKIVTYTSAQRRVESGAKGHARELRRLLDLRESPSRQTAGELQGSIGSRTDQPGATRSSSKSCVQLTFEHYLRSRAAVSEDLTVFYRRSLFREQRFDAYLGRRASVDRFASRIKAAFGTVAAILYGDWGRTPNLRHQPPSPGVGLRRSLCSHFKVILVHEAYTSSICPSCHNHDMTKPQTGGGGKEVHHLLRCRNDLCSCQWWNRDVLGALNILECGKHALRTGRWHPVFAAAAA